MPKSPSSADRIEAIGHRWAVAAHDIALGMNAENIDLLRRELRLAVEAIDGWQPITTAPKDAPIDLWCDGEHLSGFRWEAAYSSWSGKEGYPAVKRVLRALPTHWRHSTSAPVSIEQAA